jgi:hypothetical protein
MIASCRVSCKLLLAVLQGPAHLSSEQQPQQPLRQRLTTLNSSWQRSLQQQQPHRSKCEQQLYSSTSRLLKQYRV